MAKVKKSKKAKTEKKPKVAEEPKQLSPTEYEQLGRDLDTFQDSFLSFLAGTSQFEVVPTTDEEGNQIPEKNLELIRRECTRLGFRVLYSVDYGKNVLFINPDTMKIGIMTHTVEVH